MRAEYDFTDGWRVWQRARRNTWALVSMVIRARKDEIKGAGHAGMRLLVRSACRQVRRDLDWNKRGW